MKAYTLIELIIVIGILAILTGLASLSMVSFSKSSDVNASGNIVTSALKQARGNSIADIDDKAWGVHLLPNRLIIFSDSGEGYVEGASGNQVKNLSSNTTETWSLAGGGADIIFAKRTGKTPNAGTITITGSMGEKEININGEGLIE